MSEETDKICAFCGRTGNLEVRIEFGSVFDDEWYSDQDPIYFCDDCWNLRITGLVLFYTEFQRMREQVNELFRIGK